MTCFTPGTPIATPRGPVMAEDLRPGDTVITRDNGLRRIIWTDRRTVDYAALQAAPHLRPVLLRRGSLGDGLPATDMMVAPNQRILVESDRTALCFADHLALVAAKHLVNNRTVQSVPMLGVTYIHAMCAEHEMVLANGCWCELFQPADISLNGLGNAQRNELGEIFPALSPNYRLCDSQPTGPIH